ncbi:GntR family transcriptional regulator [Microbacterium sp. 2216-1]|uniref:GntR family transcriptional regulator n=1 Tax=Microbacterium TaxID=33882 RepID=UPI0019D37A43|nr:GntR family transcriptional regulator [Microbacterium esteraromaticum]MBN7793126.1 GntR family transcriptional regulator [Microbacterium esteraromaticum]MCA1305754.1 GntR family transcriptional regulator [Microbacterium esteraromaticum]
MPRDLPRSVGRAAVPRVSRLSTVDLIAIELRKAIFSGALAVGASLGEVEIAAQLGVSRSPLREAAQRLVQEGILVAIPGRGMSVAVIEGDQIADVYEMRLAIEAQAARRVARAGNAGALQRIRKAFDDLVAVSDGEDARAIGDADLEFHQVLVDAAGSERMTRAMAALVMQTRIMSFSVADGYSVRRSVSPTYTVLLDALAAGDADAAAAALEKQFSDAVSRLRGDADVDTVEVDLDEQPQVFQPIDGAMRD